MYMPWQIRGVPLQDVPDEQPGHSASSAADHVVGATVDNHQCDMAGLAYNAKHGAGGSGCQTLASLMYHARFDWRCMFCMLSFSDGPCPFVVV